MNVIISNKNKDIFSKLNVDVSKRLEGEFTVEEIVRTFSNFFFNRMFLDITAVKDYKDLNNLKKLSVGLDVEKIIILLDENNEIVNSSNYISEIIGMGYYNFTTNIEGLNYLYNNPNQYKDVAHLHKIEVQVPTVSSEKTFDNTGVSENNRTNKVFGFKNVTDGAGSSSLVYMLKKELSKQYSVVGIEVDKRDFIFYNDELMVSTTNDKLEDTIYKYKNSDILLVDLNNYSNDSIFDRCFDDVYYLIEPSTIKLNKLMTLNKNIFVELGNKKIVLNRILLNNSDIHTFEVETGCFVFYNLPTLNDKEDNSNILLPFLEKIGLVKKVDVLLENEETDNKFKFSDLFKK